MPALVVYSSSHWPFSLGFASGFGEANFSRAEARRSIWGRKMQVSANQLGS